MPGHLLVLTPAAAAPVVSPTDRDEILLGGDWSAPGAMYPVGGVVDVLCDDNFMVLVVRDI